MYRLVCASTVAAFLGSALVAQQADPKAATLSRAEQTFIQDASKANQDEIAMGQLAQKSSNPQVKIYGDKLVADHTKVQKDLQALAAAKGVTLETYDASSSSEYNRLSAMTGAEFDRSFATRAVADHRRAISMYTTAFRNAHDPELRTYINDTLPHLRTHLTEAEMLQRGLGKG
jgi:putative membrane protein